MEKKEEENKTTVSSRIEEIQKANQAKIDALLKEGEEAILKLMAKELDKVRPALVKAVENFVFDKDKVITIWKDDDGGLNLKYASVITKRTTASKKDGNGAGKKLKVPADVQEAWRTQAEYESAQAFYRAIAPGAALGNKKDQAHADRDAFMSMKAEGAEAGGMSLTKAWAKITAHNS